MTQAAIRLIKSSERPKPALPGASTADREARYARVGKSCGELEPEIHDLANMAKLAADAVADAIGESHKHITGNPELYFLTDTTVNSLLFAVNHLRTMIQNHEAAFLKALELDGGGE